MEKKWRKNLGSNYVCFHELISSFWLYPSRPSYNQTRYLMIWGKVLHCIFMLNDRKQCVKINNMKSDLRNTVPGVRQGSIVGQVSFSILFNYSFSICIFSSFSVIWQMIILCRVLQKQWIVYCFWIKKEMVVLIGLMKMKWLLILPNFKQFNKASVYQILQMRI